jgi:formaldehyde-activating enzyme involved in methanogenesis
MLEYLQLHWADIIAAVTAVVTAASLIANLTPTDADNKVLAVISKFIHMLALNFKK